MSLQLGRLQKESLIQEHHRWKGEEEVVGVPLCWNEGILPAFALEDYNVEEEQHQDVNRAADPADPRAYRKKLVSSGSVED